jgi:CheY-like chemotaxis protein
MRMNAKQAEHLIQQLRVLVVEDNPFMRNLVRNMLGTIGVKKVYEASDGIAGLEMLRSVTPDVMRSPGVFPLPDIPIILLTAHGERWRIVEAAKLGINEFLCKPVSAKSLLDRLLSILLKPRENIQIGEYYGPVPRHPTAAKAEEAADESTGTA